MPDTIEAAPVLTIEIRYNGKYFAHDLDVHRDISKADREFLVQIIKDHVARDVGKLKTVD